MADYTPSTERVRDVYAAIHASRPERYDLTECQAEFDRWLQAHDTKIEKAVLARVIEAIDTDGASLRLPKTEAPTVIVRTGWGGVETVLAGVSDHGTDNLADDYAGHDKPECACDHHQVTLNCLVQPIEDDDVDILCNCIGELEADPAPCPVHGRCSCPDNDYELFCPLHGRWEYRPW